MSRAAYIVLLGVLIGCGDDDVDEAICGNEVVEAPEACDDGNALGDDGCENDCTFTCSEDAECGECGVCVAHVCGEAAEGVACDADGDAETSDICVEGACVASGCEDGFVEIEGECVASRCGDGVVAMDEDCDDENEVAGDGCEDDCAFSCDGACDDGNACNGDESCTNHVCVSENPPSHGMACDRDGDEETDDVCIGGTCLAGECGDGVTSGEEACDDANDIEGDGCEPDCSRSPTAFRVTSLQLGDPHVYTSGATCDDVSELLDMGLTDSLATLDLNVVLVFRPFDAEATTGRVDLVFGECSGEAPDISCSVGAGVFTETVAHNERSPDVCAQADAATLNPLYAFEDTIDGPCFASEPKDITLVFGTAIIPLEDARVAAVFDDAPSTLTQGLLYGFLTEEAAKAAEALPGATLYSVLAAGGAEGSSCSTEDDRDTSGGESGFFMYIAFTAEAVAWVD